MPNSPQPLARSCALQPLIWSDLSMTVMHPVSDPKARVLLIRSFASERHFSYHPWVRWARYLAARGIEVLRYDYRGVGESSGVFEELSFADWTEDVRILTNWFGSRSPHVPLILHGLETGAVLAGRRFHEGTGDALLLWSGLRREAPTTPSDRACNAGRHWNSCSNRHRTAGRSPTIFDSWSRAPQLRCTDICGRADSGGPLLIVICRPR